MILPNTGRPKTMDSSRFRDHLYKNVFWNKGANAFSDFRINLLSNLSMFSFGRLSILQIFGDFFIVASRSSEFSDELMSSLVVWDHGDCSHCSPPALQPTCLHSVKEGNDLPNILISILVLLQFRWLHSTILYLHSFSHSFGIFLKRLLKPTTFQRRSVQQHWYWKEGLTCKAGVCKVIATSSVA